MSDALLIAAHGSRDPSGIAELRAFAADWQSLRPDRFQAVGFLEFAEPTIGEAADRLVDEGARRIVVSPAMLMAAGHVKNDVPSEIQELRLRHSRVEFVMSRAPDVHPALLELCAVRYREALADRAEVPSERTALLLVGRGTSDPDANANVAKVARFLWESYGVNFATVAYSGLARPGVEEALAMVTRLGFARVVVQPYLLFDGVLVKRVIETAARFEGPSAEVVVTGHLGSHPFLLRAFEDRVHEAIHGAPGSNCDLCKYRVKLIGREAELGLPQAGGHHHVRASTTVDEGDDHDHRRRSRPRKAAVAPLPEAGPDAAHPWDDRLLRRLRLVDAG